MAKAPLLLLATFLTLSYSALSEERLGHGHVMAPAPAPEGHHHHHHHHQAPAPSPTKPPGHHHHQAPSPSPTKPPGHHHHHAPTHSPAQPPTHHHQGPAHAPAMSPTHPPSHHHAPTHAPAVSPTHHHAPTHAPSVTPVHPPSHHHAPAPVHPPRVSPAHPPATPRHFPRSFVAVQGVVYCKSCKYSGADTFQDASPLLGAGVKLVCNNTKYRPVVVQAKTDKNGYFYVEAPKTITSYAAHKCKVSLVSSPLATCSTPSAFRAASSGALKPQKQFQNQKLPFVLYSVGPFAFEPTCKHN